MTMRAFLNQRLNGRKWVVARRSTRLEQRGYEVFFSQKQWASMKAEAYANGVIDL